MGSYTVQSGDTLSGIAAQNGTSVGAISGYKSGNPNLIYPGEVVSWGGGSAAPAAAAPAASTGPDSSALVNFGNQYTSDYQSMLDKQNATQQGLFDQYTNAVNNQEKLPALYTRLQNEQGIPQLGQQLQGYKDEIYRTQGLLDRLSSDVTSRTTGTLTTNAQRDAILTSEGNPLRDTLGRLSTGMQPLTDQMTAAQGQLSTLLPLYEQQQAKELSPLEMQINSLSDRFAREITGFTAERQQSLTAILDEIQRGRQLSDRDWQAAQTLAAEERAYSHNLSLAKIAASSSNYLTPSASSNYTTPASATPIMQLPSLASNMIQIQGGGGGGNIIQPAYGGNIQGGSGNFTLQGSSGGSLQGGSGIRLQ